ncbi:hypothetical protein HY772_07080 [Candidatus Woesearchaeota archaeon]|nr:hypothetical protein [Candidatus Woesearchaeota archaeon]
MNKLRESVKKRIYSVLDASYFTFGSFDTQFEMSSKKPPIVFAVTFRPKRTYSYIVGQKETGRLVITRSPGVYKETETVGALTFDDCIDGLERWCICLKEELQSGNPFYDELQELRRKLEQRIEEHIKDKDAHFTPEEKTDIQTKIDALCKQFEDLKAKSAITEQELKKVKEELANIRKDTEVFSRKVWYHTAGNKLLNIMSRILNSETAKSIAEKAFNQFLLGDGSSPPES